MDAVSLDTGNSTRDGSMRNEHLETSKFPTIDFLLQTVQAVTHRGENWEFTAEGTLSLHGVSRDIQFPVRAHREGDVIRLLGHLPRQDDGLSHRDSSVPHVHCRGPSAGQL